MQCSKYWSFLTHNYYTLQLKQTFISTVTFHRVCVRASLYAKFMYFSIAALKYALYMLNFLLLLFYLLSLNCMPHFFFQLFWYYYVENQHTNFSRSNTNGNRKKTKQNTKVLTYIFLIFFCCGSVLRLFSIYVLEFIIFHCMH